MFQEICGVKSHRSANIKHRNVATFLSVGEHTMRCRCVAVCPVKLACRAEFSCKDIILDLSPVWVMWMWKFRKLFCGNNFGILFNNQKCQTFTGSSLSIVKSSCFTKQAKEICHDHDDRTCDVYFFLPFSGILMTNSENNLQIEIIASCCPS